MGERVPSATSPSNLFSHRSRRRLILWAAVSSAEWWLVLARFRSLVSSAVRAAVLVVPVAVTARTLPSWSRNLAWAWCLTGLPFLVAFRGLVEISP